MLLSGQVSKYTNQFNRPPFQNSVKPQSSVITIPKNVPDVPSQLDAKNLLDSSKSNANSILTNFEPRKIEFVSYTPTGNFSQYSIINI